MLTSPVDPQSQSICHSRALVNISIRYNDAFSPEPSVRLDSVSLVTARPLRVPLETTNRCDMLRIHSIMHRKASRESMSRYTLNHIGLFYTNTCRLTPTHRNSKHLHTTKKTHICHNRKYTHTIVCTLNPHITVNTFILQRRPIDAITENTLILLSAR